MLQVPCHVKFAVLTFRVLTSLCCAVQAQAAVSAAGADELAKAEAMIAVEVPGLIFIISFFPILPFKFVDIIMLFSKLAIVDNFNLLQVGEALVAAAQ